MNQVATKNKFALLVSVFFLSSGAVAAQATTDALPARAFERFGTSKLRHGSRILCLAYSPDGQFLAAGGNDPVRLWNPKTGELLREINEPWVHAMAFSPSGETVVLGGYQKVVKLWNVKLGTISRLDDPKDERKAAIKALAVSFDNSTIASGSQDGRISLWNLESKTKYTDLVGHSDEVTALAFSPKDNNLLASAGSDRAILLWNVETKLSKIKIDAGCGVLALVFSPDGKSLYSAGDDQLIRRWDVASGKPTGIFKGHTGIIVSLIAHGDTLISGALDKTIRFWDVGTTEQKRMLERSQGDCDALALTKAGDFLATAGLNNTIRIFEAASGKEIIPAAGIQSGLAGLILTPDNKRLISATADGQILSWETATRKLMKQWDSKLTSEINLALTLDGKTLAAASSSAVLWNADAGAEIAPLAIRLGDTVVTLAFSPDGKTLALGHRSGQIDLWDTGQQQLVGSLKYPSSLHAIAWSPDGKKLAAGGGPKIFIWDPQARSLVRSFDFKDGPAPVFPTVKTLAFGPDSKSLAAGGWDAVIRIYNLNAKNPAEEKEVKQCDGHLSAINAVAFSADGRTLVSGSFDKTVRLWEAFSGKQIALYKGHIGEVMGVAFAADGRSVYSASADTTMFRWDVLGLSSNGKLPDLTLTPLKIDDAWIALTTEETPRGHKTMWEAIASGKHAIPQMAAKLYLLEPEVVKRLFRDLDSTNYPTRLAAMNKLEGYGRWMEGRYDEAIASSPSVEYRRRVEILKEKVNATNAPSLIQERLRVRRFMLMCEQYGGPDAIAALQKLADKGPEDDLREEAQASLQRLKK